MSWTDISEDPGFVITRRGAVSPIELSLNRGYSAGLFLPNTSAIVANDVAPSVDGLSHNL
jgi:hypothetical protein